MKICHILQIRDLFLEDRTLGKVYINGEFFCYSLEDALRVVKIAGKTAIPEGLYKVKLTHSNKFKRIMPLLINVPEFKGVRIHGGTKPEDTAGCPLYAFNRSGNVIWTSAEKNLTRIIREFKETYISIHNFKE